MPTVRFFQMRFLHQHDIVHHAGDDLRGVGTGLLDRDAFGQRIASAGQILVLELTVGRRIEPRLHADDFQRPGLRLRDRAHAGNEAAPADGHDQRFHIGRVRQQFERHGALPGSHARLVEALVVVFQIPARPLCQWHRRLYCHLLPAGANF